MAIIAAAKVALFSCFVGIVYPSPLSRTNKQTNKPTHSQPYVQPGGFDTRLMMELMVQYVAVFGVFIGVSWV